MLEKSAVFVYMSSRFTELNEIDVVLKFFDSGMKIQNFNLNSAKWRHDFDSEMSFWLI